MPANESIIIVNKDTKNINALIFKRLVKRPLKNAEVSYSRMFWFSPPELAGMNELKPM